MAKADANSQIVFVGVNIQNGDFAKWIPIGDPDGCDSRDATATSTLLSGDMGSFIFPRAGLYVLCYRFTHTLYLPWVLYDHIRTAVMSLPERPIPFATAAGCVSNITIDGAGFDAFGTEAPSTLQCAWRGYGKTAAVKVSDTQVTCLTPAPGTAGASLVLSLAVSPAGSSVPWAELEITDAFIVFDLATIHTTAILHTGAPFNRVIHTRLTGFGFADYGTPACSFGGYVSGVGSVSSDGTSMNCSKPAFPNEVRDLSVGEFRDLSVGKESV